jgi:hypothetical protein
MYKKAEGCQINWKEEEKNLTKSFEIKKQRNKSESTVIYAVCDVSSLPLA